MRLRHNRILTDAFREIQHTRSRFLSLMILSALSVCFLAGLRATAPDMKKSADLYFDQQNLMDLRVLSTLGLTEEDAAALARQPGVEAVERAYTVDAMVQLADNDYIVKVLSYTEDPGINAPRLAEGRMPQSAGECLVEPALLEETGLQLGDLLTLDTGTGNFQDALRTTEFTIVGTADSPLYIGTDRGTSSLGTGKVSAFVLLPLDAFSMDTFTDFFVRVQGAEDLLCYDSSYTDLIDALTEDLEPFAEERARLRGDAVIGEATEKVTEAEQELADAEAEAEQELSEAWAELQDARSELDDGWDEYQDGAQELRDQVAEANQEIADGQQELADALADLQDGEQELADARTELDDGWDEYQEGLADYQAGLEKFEDGREQYEEGLAEYNQGLAEFREAQRKVADGWDQYYAGLDQYHSGVQELAQGRQTLQAQQQAFQAGLTAFRNRLPALGLNSYESNEALLSAMADGATAKQIDDTLTSIRTGLETALDQMQALNETIQTAEETIRQQTQIHSTLEARLEDLTAQLESPTLDEEARGALQQQLEETQAALEDASGRLEAAQRAKSSAESGLAQLQNTVGTAEAVQAQLGALYTTVNGQSIPVSTEGFLSGQRAITDGWAAISANQAKLDAVSQELADSRAQLLDAEDQLEDGRRELDEGRRKLQDVKEELDAGWEELEDARRQLEDAKAELEDGEREYADGRAELDGGWRDYYDGIQELEDARKTLAQETADAQAELADARSVLNDGEADYADGLAEYEEGKAEAEEQIAEARKELEQAHRDIESIEACEWYLLGRNTNSGYVSYSMDADRMGNLANLFPLIFFLVAALVCLTTMTRMVEEQRVTIGGLKALGYSKAAIAVKYVGYGFLASAVGALAGLAVGLTLLPWIICNAWNIIYTLGPVQYGLEPATSAAACLAAVGTVTLSALGACFSTLTASPAQLMRPKAPPAGKRVLLERIPWLWRRLSFNYKITLRNLFRYQRRFWMTVIGIGGCAALIVTAFGLRGSIFDIMDKQFDEIYGYTAQVGLVDKVTPGELREVTDALEESPAAEGWLVCHSESITAETADYTLDCTLQAVPSQEALEPFVHLRHRTDDTPVILPDDGVVLTEKMASLLGVQPGDTLTLDGGSRVEVPVADVTEHYIQHAVYMTDACYEALFGTMPQQNLILADYPVDGDGTEELERELVSLDGVTSLTRVEDTREIYGSSLESVDYAVVLIIVCAAALAFVVLYNLTNINITERMRELATLKVLGFYDRELSAYIYRENVILTVFGVALGMLMGKLLHQWLILTVEIDMLMFGRELSLSSYAYAVVLTVIFSLLVNLAAHQKLKKLDMVESLKTVE